MIFTIAIPVYNGEKTIEAALRSVTNQDYDKEYEIIVANNNSQDKTEKIVRKYSQVKLYNFQETVLHAENHNRCLNLAKGDYIVFCHADDKLDSRCLETFERKLRERNFAQKYVCWGRTFIDFSRNWQKGYGEFDKALVGQYAFLPFCLGGLTFSGTLFSRKSFLQAGGLLNTKHFLQYSDVTTMIYLAEQGFAFEMISDLVFEYRQSSSNHPGVPLEERYKAIEDAFRCLLEKIGQERLLELYYLSKTMMEGITPFDVAVYRLKLVPKWRIIKINVVNLYFKKLRKLRKIINLYPY